MKNATFFLVFIFALWSCKNEASADVKSDAITSVQMPEKELDYEASAATDSAAVVLEETQPNTEQSFKKIEPQIIKNANLRYESQDLANSYQIVLNAVKKNKGIIQNDNEGKDYQTLYRNLVIRIPSANFDAFINEISTGVTYFDRKEISSSDVTEEYVDVISRIKTKKALEERYLQLLNKATKVSEILEVEQQLAQIREEVEAKEGRLKYLKDRVSQSTINLEIYKTNANQSGATTSFGSKIVNAIKSGFNSISIFFIGLLEIWPFIAILVAVIYFIRKRLKKKSQKNVQTP